MTELSPTAVATVRAGIPIALISIVPAAESLLTAPCRNHAKRGSTTSA